MQIPQAERGIFFVQCQNVDEAEHVLCTFRGMILNGLLSKHRRQAPTGNKQMTEQTTSYVKCVQHLPSYSIVAAVLWALTSQSAIATTDKSVADDNEWVDIYVSRQQGSKSTVSTDTFAIKRADWGNGVEGFCVRVPTDPKNPPKKHCGASTVWIKGDHSKNSSVRFRTSLTRYSLKCVNWEYSKDQFITYSSSGDVITQWERLGQLRAIIPGSFEERIARAHCANPQ